MRNRESADGMWVAIVDDDVSFREAVVAHLGFLGVEPHAFANGVLLLESEFLRHFHCVFADYSMPGMNGVELHNRLTRAGVAAPFILMSSGLTERMKVDAQARGIFDILEKPFSPGVMLGVLERVGIR